QPRADVASSKPAPSFPSSACTPPSSLWPMEKGVNTAAAGTAVGWSFLSHLGEATEINVPPTVFKEQRQGPSPPADRGLPEQAGGLRKTPPGTICPRACESDNKTVMINDCRQIGGCPMTQPRSNNEWPVSNNWLQAYSMDHVL